MNILKVTRNICNCHGDREIENLSLETIYTYEGNYLLGLRYDKHMKEIFLDFESETLELAYFLVGGASIHDEYNYRYTIHPYEKIHENLPHVHVSKGGVETRFLLESFEALDKLRNPHKKDYKKVILPFLIEHQSELMTLWNYYMKGYQIPEITQEGKPFYPES